MVKIWWWIDAHIIDLARQMRLSYLPPYLVCMAAGIFILTVIVGALFVKETFGLLAYFLALPGIRAGLTSPAPLTVQQSAAARQSQRPGHRFVNIEKRWKRSC